MGAYLQLVTPGIPLLGAWIYNGAYDIPNYSVRFTGVFTTTPTDAYRGAGRPEATYVIERTIEALADELGMDSVELRQKNFIAEFPHTLASGLTVDAGNYDANLDKLLELLDLESIRSDQRTSRARRREAARRRVLDVQRDVRAPRRESSARSAVGGWDSATIRFQPLGSVQVITGTSPHGQSHETSWAQIAADALGVDIDDVEVLRTATPPSRSSAWTPTAAGRSPSGDRALYAGEKIVDKARADRRPSARGVGDDLEFANGTFSVKGSPDKAMTIKEARSPRTQRTTSPTGWSPASRRRRSTTRRTSPGPAGAHAAVVEVDIETGDARLVRYVAVDDVGAPVNLMIIDGQVHGGVAQAVAAALYEEGVYDESGNLLTANMTTYLMPSAAELPSFEVARTETQSPTNPLGVKGVGETGTIAATPAVISAVVDALSHLGITDIQLPATPERVARAIEEAKR